MPTWLYVYLPYWLDEQRCICHAIKKRKPTVTTSQLLLSKIVLINLIEWVKEWRSWQSVWQCVPICNTMTLANGRFELQSVSSLPTCVRLCNAGFVLIQSANALVCVYGSSSIASFSDSHFSEIRSRRRTWRRNFKVIRMTFPSRCASWCYQYIRWSLWIERKYKTLCVYECSCWNV